MGWFCAYESWYLDTKLSTSYKDYLISLVINLWAFVVSSHTNKAHYLSVLDNTRECLSEHLPVIDKVSLWSGVAGRPFAHGFRQCRVDPDSYTDTKDPPGDPWTSMK